MNEDKSARYHKLKRRSALVGLAWSAGLLFALLITPGSILLRDAATGLVAQVSFPPWLVSTAAVSAYVLLLGAIHEAGALPLSFYRGFLLEHRYGLSTETLRGWVADQLKGLAVGGALSLAGFVLLYAAIRRWPGAWWMVAGSGFAVLSAVMAHLAPTVILPIFFRFRPLSRPDLRDRLLSLSRRAGVPALDACEWRLSDRTKKANAALAGLGRTRRILVSDTLLASHGDDEIEVILAHEIGHHVHGDIWRGIGVETAAAYAGFFLAALALRRVSPAVGLDGVADPAGIPVLVLVAGVLSVMLLPVTNGLSRAMERAADRFAWELTGNPGAFITAMQRLSSLNLAEERPSRLSLWLFHSHPPVGERVAAARDWDASRPA